MSDVRELEKRAEAGDAQAQYELGCEYYAFRKDYTKAVHYFRRAAEMGHLPSCLELGKHILRGIGGEKDYNYAKELIKKAADGGIAEAQELLKRLEDD